MPKKKSPSATTDLSPLTPQVTKKSKSEIAYNSLLDNLARLLEGNSITCSAVCFDNDKFIFTKNDFTMGTGSKGSAFFTLIRDLVSFLELEIEEANHKKNESKQEVDNKVRAQSIFKDICWQKLASEEGVLHPSTKETAGTPEAILIDRMIIQIIEESLIDSEAWKDFSVSDIVKKFNLGGTEDYSYSNPLGLALQILGAYYIAGRAANDFNKVIDDIKITALKSKKFIVVQDTEGCGVHAEMRIIDRLFEEGDLLERAKRGEQVYIGISKVCCTDCNNAIKALNQVLAKINQAQDLKYDLEIIEDSTKLINKPKNQGKLIITQDGEVFDYTKGKFVKLPAYNKLIPELITNGSSTYELLQDSGKINLEQYNQLTKEVGCYKKTIICGDVSRRETHGLSFKGKWSDHKPRFFSHLKIGKDVVNAYEKIKAKHDKEHKVSPSSAVFMSHTPSPPKKRQSGVDIESLSGIAKKLAFTPTKGPAPEQNATSENTTPEVGFLTPTKQQPSPSASNAGGTPVAKKKLGYGNGKGSA